LGYLMIDLGSDAGLARDMPVVTQQGLVGTIVQITCCASVVRLITDADSAVTTIANLAMANLRRLPPGTLPPVVLKFDASSLPVCLITLKGEGLNEARLRDMGQYTVRNQVANVPGASVPQPFGGRYRQIMVYVDPLKLEAHQLSIMDVVRAIGESNVILPAGDVQLGRLDYNIYTNSQLSTVREINNLPVKTVGQAPIRISDIGYAKDAQQIQTNLVRVDGQPSVYLPVLKQGGDTNTIAVVDGIKDAVLNLFEDAVSPLTPTEKKTWPSLSVPSTPSSPYPKRSASSAPPMRPLPLSIPVKPPST